MNGSFGIKKMLKKGLSFADCDLKGYEMNTGGNYPLKVHLLRDWYNDTGPFINLFRP